MPDAVHRLGVRELRAEVAAVVRRAAGGERIVITVDGVPTAQLGPLHPDGEPTLTDLVALGLVRAPGRVDKPHPPDPFAVPVDVRLGSVIAEIRGAAP